VHTMLPTIRRTAILANSLFGIGALLAGIVTTRADSWETRSPVPGARAAHSAVWTGREMIVWGGGVDGSFLNTGGRYLPATDTWRAASLRGAPSPRWFHAAVWTGNEMIIWGAVRTFLATTISTTVPCIIQRRIPGCPCPTRGLQPGARNALLCGPAKR